MVFSDSKSLSFTIYGLFIDTSGAKEQSRTFSEALKVTLKIDCFDAFSPTAFMFRTSISEEYSLAPEVSTNKA